MQYIFKSWPTIIELASVYKDKEFDLDHATDHNSKDYGYR